MKNIFPAILCLFCSALFILPLQAQQQKKKNARVKLVPVYIDLSQSRQTIEESKPEKVIIDRSNVTILDKAPEKKVDKKRLSKTILHKMARWTPHPEKSLAKRLAASVQTERIRWQPFSGSLYPSGTSLMDAELSPDNSVIVFLERVGKTPGPYGTRIVLYDTHQWQILQAEDLEEVNAVSCSWSGNDRIALLCAGQKSAHTKNSLSFYDPQAKKLLSTHELDFSPGKSFISVGEDDFLITEKDSAKIHFFHYDKFFKSLEKIKVLDDCISEPVLFHALSAAFFHACDGKNIFSYAISEGRLVKKLPLPDLDKSFRIQTVLPLPNTAFLLVPAPASGTALRYFHNNDLLSIGTASSGLIARGFPPSTFTAGFSRGGEFGIYELPSLKRTILFSANTSKPKTQGSPLYIFAIPHAKAFAVMDSRGIFYLLYPDRAGRRYLKEILTEQQL